MEARDPTDRMVWRRLIFRSTSRRSYQRRSRSARMKRSNTSFESNRPREVSETRSSRCSISPDAIKFCNAASRLIGGPRRILPQFRAGLRRDSAEVPGKSFLRRLPDARRWSAEEPHRLTYSSRESAARESHSIDLWRCGDQHRVRVHSEAEIGLPRPIFQVVHGFEPLAGKVGNLVLLNRRPIEGGHAQPGRNPQWLLRPEQSGRDSESRQPAIRGRAANLRLLRACRR